MILDHLEGRPAVISDSASCEHVTCMAYQPGHYRIAHLQLRTNAILDAEPQRSGHAFCQPDCALDGSVGVRVAHAGVVKGCPIVGLASSLDLLHDLDDGWFLVTLDDNLGVT